MMRKRKKRKRSSNDRGRADIINMKLRNKRRRRRRKRRIREVGEIGEEVRPLERGGWDQVHKGRRVVVVADSEPRPQTRKRRKRRKKRRIISLLQHTLPPVVVEVPHGTTPLAPVRTRLLPRPVVSQASILHCRPLLKEPYNLLVLAPLLLYPSV